ncbi:MAG: DUF255 domain-containing protein [Opitutales bacterium]
MDRLLWFLSRLAVLCLASAHLVACAEAPAENDGHAHAHAQADGPNRLIDETSPYLRQHAHNPVDWYPWGDEAFAKARREDKPIFLSVGYSTCYWCHVMEKESFEDPEVARILNEHYVAIKVDREERPDVDKHYMLATQLVTGRGGWPNSVWLIPGGKPWMAGTYFPKPPFMSALNQLADAWENRRDDIERQARQLTTRMEQIGSLPEGNAEEPSMALVRKAAEELTNRFEPEHAGFGTAPKFPPHGTLRLLMALAAVDDTPLPTTVTRTLDAMWLGGMHDHIGGGFHRYSTDTEWLLPHFEKMLYDNAQLLRNYAEAAAVTGVARYRQVVADIHRWLTRDMTHPEGGFYSAIDSGEVGEEGAFYLWTIKELKEVLGEEDAALFADIYGFQKRGNFREESTGRRTGENIPHLERPIAEIAKARGREPEALREQLATLRAKLLAVRRTRPYPHKDDKILTGWNGLMIEALALAGRRLQAPEYTESAEQAADFILSELWTGDGLLRSYRGGEAHQPAFLDDHAYFAAGLLELHASTDDERWLRAARRLGDTLLAEFRDPDEGGFYLTAESAQTPFARSKALQGGGNLPDPNGTAARVLLELSRRTGEPRYAQAAGQTIEAFAGVAAAMAHAKEEILLAMLKARQDPTETTPPPGEPAIRLSPASDDPGSGPSPGHSAATHAREKREDPVTFRIAAPKKSYAPGESIPVSLRLNIDEGWHLYGDNPELDFLVPVQIEPVPLPRFTVGEVTAPEPRKKTDPILEKTVYSYEGAITFTIPFRVSEDAQSGPALVALRVTMQACDAERCLAPETVTLRLPVAIR